MSAHTPGPWHFDKELSGEWSDELDDMDYTKGYVRSIRAGDDARAPSICGTCDGCNPITPENARLIAAAPDLLAALEEQVAEFDKRCAEYRSVGDEGIAAMAELHHGKRMDRARAAIAKARGAK